MYIGERGTLCVRDLQEIFKKEYKNYATAKKFKELVC